MYKIYTTEEAPQCGVSSDDGIQNYKLRINNHGLFSERRHDVHLFRTVGITVVMVTRFKRILQFTTLICFQHVVYLAMTSSYDCYTVSGEFVVRAHTHVASQHN